MDNKYDPVDSTEIALGQIPYLTFFNLKLTVLKEFFKEELLRISLYISQTFYIPIYFIASAIITEFKSL